MLELGASDLHLHADYPLTYRVDGSLTKKGNPLSNRNLIALFGEILTQDQKVRLNRGQELDFAYEIKGSARYRGNIFLQDGKFGGVFRLIPNKIQDFEMLGIPEGVRTLCEKKSGLVLVTGPTGSGKSTTMAADRLFESH
jgi:twitching motility protein PilT